MGLQSLHGFSQHDQPQFQSAQFSPQMELADFQSPGSSPQTDSVEFETAESSPQAEFGELQSVHGSEGVVDFQTENRTPEEDLAEFRRVAGVLCVYLLALRAWQKSAPEEADAALERLTRAEGFVYGLLDELILLSPSSRSLVVFFVQDMFHTGEGGPTYQSSLRTHIFQRYDPAIARGNLHSWNPISRSCATLSTPRCSRCSRPLPSTPRFSHFVNLLHDLLVNLCRNLTIIMDPPYLSYYLLYPIMYPAIYVFFWTLLWRTNLVAGPR